MLKKILLGLVLVLAVFAVVVALQPSEFLIQRSATIAAPPSAVFEHINDFHQWQAWSPWAKLDPKTKSTFDGPESGKGAKFAWAGNSDVGEGDMTIIESHPNDLVKIDLHFIKPYENSCVAQFDIKPEGDKSQVIWSMSGHKNFVSKAVCLFMNMDKTVGGDFEKGLAAMKTEVEGKK